MDTAENRLRVMPNYNLSRGTLRLFARMVRDRWDDPDRDPELITGGDIDWLSPRILTDLTGCGRREPHDPSTGGRDPRSDAFTGINKGLGGGVADIAGGA